MRYVTLAIICTVKNDNEADEVSCLGARFAETLAAKGHTAGVRIEQVERPDPPGPNVVNPRGN